MFVDNREEASRQNEMRVGKVEGTVLANMK